MSETGSITQWIDELQRGNNDAAAAVWDCLSPKLKSVAERILRSSPVRAVDGDDVVNSAFFSCCRRMEAGQYPDVADEQTLLALLLTIVRRKARHAIRHESAAKRGGGKNRGDSVFSAKDNTEAPQTIDAIAGQDDTPAELAARNEIYAQALDILTDHQLKVALLHLDGHTNTAIAKEIGCSIPTVERRLRRIREIWTCRFTNLAE